MAGSLNSITVEQENRLRSLFAQAAEEAYLKATLRERVIWACRAVKIADPAMPNRAVFHAVGIGFGLSPDWVRKVFHKGLNPKPNLEPEEGLAS